jgi:hypothetical protein
MRSHILHYFYWLGKTAREFASYTGVSLALLYCTDGNTVESLISHTPSVDTPGYDLPESMSL